MKIIIVALLTAMIISYLATPLAILLAPKIGAIDIPKDARRVHKEPIPRLGGLAIYLGFLVATLLYVPLNKEIIGLLIASCLMIIMGVIDDTHPLDSKTKLLIQIISAAIVVSFGVQIDFISHPIITDKLFVLDYLSVPITIFWIVGITNTVNLIDGLDGLAAGISAIAAITLGIVSYLNGSSVYTILLACLAGGVLGFLPYNFNPAKIFMGDTGSLFLGFSLSIISIEGAVKGATVFAVVIPVLALAIPILDTTFAIIRRKMAGKPIMEADKGHLHHRLLSFGLNQKQTVLILYIISTILGSSAILISRVQLKIGLLVGLFDIALILYGAKKLKILKSVSSKEEKNSKN
ncbi:MAG: glycosyltransferase family 4 protein [Filifactoraceae bacterium]